MMKGDWKHPLAWIDGALDALDQQGLRRKTTTRGGRQGSQIEIDGHQLVNLGSNDYLDLAGDPRLASAVVAATEREGWGSGASPLISGRGQTHRLLEEKLAEFEGTEAALAFPSGFAANAGTIAALVGTGDGVFCDRNNHASLFDGCRLSRADVRVFPHNDWSRLDDLLVKAKRYRRRLIVTDSLFSMDGDKAALVELAEVAERHQAMLMIDEAHATGVFGPSGRGVAECLGVEGRVDIRVGTLSKALGSIGGFVAGSRSLIQWLLNRARPYMFSTASPAAGAAAAVTALDIVRTEPGRRQTLLAHAQQLRKGLVEQGWNIGRSDSQIVPIIVGRPELAVRLASFLRREGFLVPAIRPPTVPEGEACLRVSLTSAHTTEMTSRLLETLSRAATSCFAPSALRPGIA
jgi:8-amino-7-oxononanoate synthase